MSFTWYDNFSDLVRMMPRESVGEFVLGITEYAETGVEPEFDYPLSGFFVMMRPNLDKSIEAHARGSKGGRPRKADPEQVKTQAETGYKPNSEQVRNLNAKQVKTKSESGSKGNDSVNDNDNESVSSINAPTRENVENFFGSHGSTKKQGANFFRTYSAQGWKRGNGNAITDWKALAELWIAEDSKDSPKPERDWPNSMPCPDCGSESDHMCGVVYECPTHGHWRAA